MFCSTTAGASRFGTGKLKEVVRLISEVNATQTSAGGLVGQLIVSAGAAADSMIKFGLMTFQEAWTSMSWLVLSLEAVGNMLKEELRFKREVKLNPPVTSGACAVASTRELASVCSSTLE
jgi:hypothetical protein